MNRKGFTLVEFLVVIGILAVLVVAAFLLLNPTEFMAQGRDSIRINDLKNIDTAIQLDKNSLDESLIDNTQLDRVYISLSDTNSDGLCNEYALPALSGNWQYRCNANSSNLKKVDSAGWIPINFTSVSTNPLAVLPVDPVNDINNYYTYTKDGALAAKLTSDKYLTEVALNDGGNENSFFETAPIAWGGGGSSAAALFAGSDNAIYKCLTSTGCDAAAEWVNVTGSPFPATTDLAVDSLNNVIYAVTSGTRIYRCILSTGCDVLGEWITAYDTGAVFFDSIVFDLVNGALYAGGGDGFMYRCNTSTGCDGGAAEWPQVLDTPGSMIQDIIRDSNNNVLYANSRTTFGGGSVIYRCPTSTGCDMAGEWVATFNGGPAGDSLYEMTFDSANNVIYAAGFDVTGAELWRCDVTLTACDANGDWTKPYAVASTNFVSVQIANDILYIGEDTSGAGGLDIDRCLLSSACDGQIDFTRYSLTGSGNNIYAIGYDSAATVLYAGTGDFATMYRCPISSSCDAGVDWTLVADKPDVNFPEIIYKP